MYISTIKKKISSLIIVFSCLFSLVGCGSDETDATDGTKITITEKNAHFLIRLFFSIFVPFS